VRAVSGKVRAAPGKVRAVARKVRGRVGQDAGYSIHLYAQNALPRRIPNWLH